MHRKRLVMLLCLAALAAVVFILNQLAVEYYLYWVYWWYDIPMHFLGGALIGGLAAWGVLSWKSNLTLGATFAYTMAAIALVGIGWEAFEYLTGQYAGQPGIVFDTTLDLIMDIIGASLAALLIHRASRPPESAGTTDL